MTGMTSRIGANLWPLFPYYPNVNRLLVVRDEADPSIVAFLGHSKWHAPVPWKKISAQSQQATLSGHLIGRADEFGQQSAKEQYVLEVHHQSRN